MKRLPHVGTMSRKACMVAACGFLLGACTNPFAEDAPGLSEVLGAGWLFKAKEARADPAVAAPLYCYGTIGKQDCYLEPLPREEGRLVGYQGPPPPSRDEL